MRFFTAALLVALYVAARLQIFLVVSEESVVVDASLFHCSLTQLDSILPLVMLSSLDISHNSIYGNPRPRVINPGAACCIR